MLEVLAGTLSLKIEEIVLGEISIPTKVQDVVQAAPRMPVQGVVQAASQISAQTGMPVKAQNITPASQAMPSQDAVISELVRTAKLQERKKQRETLIWYWDIIFVLFVGFLAFCGLFRQVFYIGISAELLKYMLVLSDGILLLRTWQTRESLFEKKNKGLWGGCLALGVLCAYITGLLFMAVRFAGTGKTLLGLEPQRMGPFLHYQLIAIGVFAYGLFLFYMYRRNRYEENLLGGMMLVLSALFLCTFYTDLLFRMDSWESTAQWLIRHGLFAVGAAALSVAAGILISRMKRPAGRGG